MRSSTARDPVEAKGKAEPIPVWEAIQPRARFGVDLLREVKTQLIGRQRDLRALQDALDRARQQRAVQLVTLVGEPGIGKSRLVFELMQVVEADPELIRWRQGRSLPYGEGSSLWALAEMAKARSGDPRNRFARRGRGKGARRGRGGHSRGGRGRLGRGPSACAGRDRRRGRARRGAVEGVVRGLAPVLRGSGERTAAGARLRGSAFRGRRACSTSSITWSTGRAGCPSSSLRPRAPSSSSGGRAGAAESPT